jgi:HlyD family secretion protein
MAGKAKWLVLLVVVAAGAGAWWYFANDGANEAPVWRTAKVSRGTIQSTVSASGSLKAVVTVEVGTQVSGQVSELRADYNTQVKKDQVIARIDPRTFEAKVKESEADLEISRGQLAVHIAAVKGMASDIVAAKAALVEAKLDLERKAKLLPGRTISKAVYDKAKSVFDQAAAKLVAAESKVLQQKAQIAVARAQVKRNQALLAQRKIDLERTFIRSPVDGVVINRSVDVGQTVAASLQAPILFTIAKDLRQMQVEVSVDEADIGRIAVGQQADFTVDSFQGRTFRGRVQQVRKASKEESNVITYTVIVATRNDDLRLLPGMTANVTFVISRRENIVRVPNRALRFRPPGVAAAQASSGSSRAARMRARLDKLARDLKLTPDQKQRVAAAYREMFTKIRALRGGGGGGNIREQFRSLRRKLMSRLQSILTPAQFKQMAGMRRGGRAGRGGRGRGQARGRPGRVWVAGADGTPRAVRVTVGITDGQHTELRRGDLKAGDRVIVGIDRTGGRRRSPRLRL